MRWRHRRWKRIEGARKPSFGTRGDGQRLWGTGRTGIDGCRSGKLHRGADEIIVVDVDGGFAAHDDDINIHTYMCKHTRTNKN